MFGAFWNTRTLSKMHDFVAKTNHCSYEKSTKMHEKHQKDEGTGEAYTKHCDIGLTPDWTKKQCRCFLLLFRAFWNSRAIAKCTSKQRSCFFALWYRRNHCSYEKASKSTKSTKRTKGDWGGLHKTLCWNQIERKSRVCAFLCFLEHSNPQQNERQNTVSVLFGAFWCFVV